MSYKRATVSSKQRYRQFILIIKMFSDYCFNEGLSVF